MNIISILDDCHWEIDPEARRAAKAVNFGVQYGVNGVIQGQAAASRQQSMLSTFQAFYSPSRGGSFLQMLGRQKRKP